MTKRRNFSDQFKAAVALETLRGDKTVQEIAAKRQLHLTQLSTWKAHSGHRILRPRRETKSGMNAHQMHLSQAVKLS
ncbi:transposase [Falsihalocynthiibacter arcticus]|uniref:transposase n=1 Tax=Falsihalocynthiibacter arcticus TaxID=1579316 RepID=UPI00146FD0A5